MENGVEQIWIAYQQNVASLRRIVIPLLRAAFEGRQQHTFTVDEGIGPLTLHRFAPRPTPGQPNGIPDLAPDFYVGRLVSVTTASLVLLVANNATQSLARALGMKGGFAFDYGDQVSVQGGEGTRASTLLYAGANHVRHVDEWAEDAFDRDFPKDDKQKKRHADQNRSMKAIADALGVEVPIRTNLSYEIVEALFGPERDYRVFEGHLLRIGLQAVADAGYDDAVVGVSVTESIVVNDIADLMDLDYVVMSGVMRAAD